MSTYHQLKTLAASLVDDVDGLINELEQNDQTLFAFRKKHDYQLEKSKEFSDRAKEHLAKADALALTVAELKAQIKFADASLRSEKGHAASFDFKAAAAERMAKQARDRARIRQEMLLRKEIDRRVNAIGRKVVRNSGFRRSGGGFSVVEDDGLLPGGRKNPDSIINKLTETQDNGTQTSP